MACDCRDNTLIVAARLSLKEIYFGEFFQTVRKQLANGSVFCKLICGQLHLTRGVFTRRTFDNPRENTAYGYINQLHVWLVTVEIIPLWK